MSSHVSGSCAMLREREMNDDAEWMTRRISISDMKNALRASVIFMQRYHNTERSGLRMMRFGVVNQKAYNQYLTSL